MTTHDHTRRSLRHQLADELRAQVLAGELAAGAQLPSEPELARRMHVARSSLRAAIALLEEEGLLRRVHGSGTYVNDRPLLRDDISRNLSVTAMITATGRTPGARLTEATPEPAPPKVAAAFGVPNGTKLSALRRVRTADGLPVVDTTDWCLPELLDPEAMANPVDGSVYRALGERGFTIHHGVATMSPAVADRLTAERLEVPEGSLLLALFQVDSTADGVVALVSHEIYRADAFVVSVYRRGPGARAGATDDLGDG
jgi:DNA-binding GntR family transcriptional regulator